MFHSTSLFHIKTGIWHTQDDNTLCKLLYLISSICSATRWQEWELGGRASSMSTETFLKTGENHRIRRPANRGRMTVVKGSKKSTSSNRQFWSNSKISKIPLELHYSIDKGGQWLTWLECWKPAFKAWVLLSFATVPANLAVQRHANANR